MRYQTLFSLLFVSIFTGCGPSAPKISIHEAVERGDVKTLKEHLEFGRDINAKNDGSIFQLPSIQMTPLYLAIFKERVELAKLLISKGADVDAKCAGMNSLHMVASSGKIELVKFLIAAGANVNARNKEDATPLQLAAVNGIEEVCELLISDGADLKAVAVNGHTPLSLATVQGNREVVILLRRHLASRR